jgi:glutamate N-acetyltransferase/amino-acid N-acetyltransferase
MLKGFRFSVTTAGIKYQGRTDLGLILSELPATAAGVFTRNRIKAAPVILSRKRIAKGRARAIVVNSGNANACTGKKGLKDAEVEGRILSDILEIPENEILIASTGVIGIPLPMERLETALPELARGTGKASVLDLARAIMTTDSFPKVSERSITLGKRTVTITGIAKGAGMISPDMATMLSFILTDAALTPEYSKAVLREVIDETFNLISVDGDTSTNDTVILLANGMAGNTPLHSSSPLEKAFRKGLTFVCEELSRMIVKDGEGATKLITIHLKGAKTRSEAARAARTVANSMLVKTALTGTEPNWGRIIAAIGRSGVPVREERITISINGIELFRKGAATAKEHLLRDSLKEDEISIGISLGRGRQACRFYTCDLTEEYVRINAEYLT